MHGMFIICFPFALLFRIAQNLPNFVPFCLFVCLLICCVSLFDCFRYTSCAICGCFIIVYWAKFPFIILATIFQFCLSFYILMRNALNVSCRLLRQRNRFAYRLSCCWPIICVPSLQLTYKQPSIKLIWPNGNRWFMCVCVRARLRMFGFV